MKVELVTYELEAGVATITLNDGSKNLVTPKLIHEINQKLDLAEKANAVVLLTGSGDTFSAGFDLKVLKNGVTDTYRMLIGGFELAARLLAFKTPTIIACNGHAIAMGAFLLLSGDYRIGSSENYKIVTNEIAIGLTIPYAAIEISRQRLTPAHFERASLLSEVYSPSEAIEAGFLDCVVTGDSLMKEATEKAIQFTKLDMKAHYETKMRARKEMLRSLKRAIQLDRQDFLLKGVQRASSKFFRVKK